MRNHSHGQARQPFATGIESFVRHLCLPIVPGASQTTTIAQNRLQAQQRFQVHGKEQVCNRMLRESAVNSIRGVFRELSKEISPILLQARQTQDSDMLVHSCPVDALNIVKLKVERMFLELFRGIALSWAQEKWNHHPNKKKRGVFDMPGPCVHE